MKVIKHYNKKVNNLVECGFGFVVMLTLAPTPFESSHHMLDFASKLITATCVAFLIIAPWQKNNFCSVLFVILWSHFLIWSQIWSQPPLFKASFAALVVNPCALTCLVIILTRFDDSESNTERQAN